MGEQVAGAAGYGWLDGVRADLEREGYASRGVDIPACSVDAPHIRQRLYWIAQNVEYTNVSYGERSGLPSRVYQKHNQSDGGSAFSHMADAHGNGSLDDKQHSHGWSSKTVAECRSRISSSTFWSDHIWLTGSDGKARRSQPGLPLLAHGIPNRVGKLRAYGNAIVAPLAKEVIIALMEVLDDGKQSLQENR
jgi:DNA (cytosine-5)-methyltransferase 1